MDRGRVANDLWSLAVFLSLPQYFCCTADVSTRYNKRFGLGCFPIVKLRVYTGTPPDHHVYLCAFSEVGSVRVSQRTSVTATATVVAVLFRPFARPWRQRQLRRRARAEVDRVPVQL